VNRAWRVSLLLAAAMLGGCRGGCGGGREQQQQRITGGGSSFVNPMMTKWASVYKDQSGVLVDYTSSGSGNGVRQMIDQKNDFGGTDAPMNDNDLKRAQGINGDVVHIPLVMGGVVPAYNLEGVKDTLRFTGAVLADIYLGKITRWNDPGLKKLNPGVDLPDLEIAVVRRSDGSGTTYIWADYLAKCSKEWETKVGVATELSWPVGVGKPKSDGIAGYVGRTNGALGYVELIYVLNKNIPYGAVQNKAGEFVVATLESVTKAAEGALTTIPDDLRFSLTDAPGKGAYPISGTTWGVMYVKQTPDKAKLLSSFFHWLTHEGQDLNAELHYARLSKGLVERVEKQLDRIKNGK
jgi:phosphate transport system substrate-binding protein